MHAWPTPEVPNVPGTPVPLSLFDTADQVVRRVELPPTGPVGMYVCGITPYDATHLGHAATYLTFDLIYRQLLDAGRDVTFVQNITDVDEPLFERAERDAVDWRDLGTSQIDLFRSDMENLAVLPPQHYMGVMESVDDVITMVGKLLDNGSAYVMDNGDIYASIHATKEFGYESNYDVATMLELFAERGGDPQREGKRDPLDALVWRAAVEGEPSWPAPFGDGRPGWHIECAAIAHRFLGDHFAIQGGGCDLIFPHHEFSAAHIEASSDSARMADHYVHTGMIGLDGVKMSKSLGNLVFVSKLTAAGVDPSAIRLGVFAGHYRTDRDWSDAVLEDAQHRLQLWRDAVASSKSGTQPLAKSRPCAAAIDAAEHTVQAVREALANDLDTPEALARIDAWASEALTEGSCEQARQLISTCVDALLGVKL